MAKITIRDIARLAGVSKSTVSRVLNRNANVDPDTRERVLRIVQERGFVPSVAATELARGRNRLIGMLVPALTWPLMPDIVQGVASVVESTPYEIVLYSFHPDKDFNHMVDRVLATNLTAGILAVLHDQSPEHLVELHKKRGLPVVLINTTALRVDIPLVVADNVGGAYLAVRHLIELGHTRIGCALGSLNLPFIDDRYEGYRKALAEAGIEPVPELVLREDFSTEGGRACVRRYFALDERPTAIFTCNDAMAYGVLAAAAELGWHVPDELAVVGFDDISPSAHVRPPLTTIRQPFEGMGKRAAEILLSLIDPNYVLSKDGKEQFLQLAPEGPASPLIPVDNDEQPTLQIQLPTSLVVRSSSGSLRKLSLRSSTTLL